MQSVSLPAGAQLVTLRVVGQANSTNAALRVRVALMRSRLLGTPQPAERIVRVEVTSDPFDGGLNIDSALATVSADHRYFLLAKHIELTLGGTTPQLLKFGAMFAAEPV